MNDINREYLIGQYAIDLRHVAHSLADHDGICAEDFAELMLIARRVTEDATANVRHRLSTPSEE